MAGAAPLAPDHAHGHPLAKPSFLLKNALLLIHLDADGTGLRLLDDDGIGEHNDIEWVGKTKVKRGTENSLNGHYETENCG